VTAAGHNADFNAHTTSAAIKTAVNSAIKVPIKQETGHNAIKIWQQICNQSKLDKSGHVRSMDLAEDLWAEPRRIFDFDRNKNVISISFSYTCRKKTR
jgi:hypothetical protein